MREIFRAETIRQFLIAGNINDLVRQETDGEARYCSLKVYLANIVFAPFTVILFYDRGKGIQLAKGGEHFCQYLQIFDKYNGTRYSSDAGVQHHPDRVLDSPGLLPRAPEQALELIDRYIRHVAVTPTPSGERGPSLAVVVDYANLVVPRGESIYLTGDTGASLVKILGWAKESYVAGADIATVLLAENLMDLHEEVVENPYAARVHIALPGKEEVEGFIRHLVRNEPTFSSLCPIEIPILADRLLGLNLVCIKSLLLRALRNNTAVTHEYLARLRKEYIEKESCGKLDFVESGRTLDDVAGHTEAKRWLREDATLMKKGALHALPMGYLIAGRIGTGKTYLVECFAGECGVPFVALRNFRDKWVGATEGNLERIFQILHALGQVVVFVDEADQMTGRRGGGEGDAGLSGRIYGMLAREMADTDNRGRILWIFATSRPDLLEVDLKRQGRLDVHIPLFPPDSKEEQRELFLAMARKHRIRMEPADMPDFSFDEPVSGNELEGLIVRALREYELQAPDRMETLPVILRKVLGEFRPSAHTLQMELMDLLAVKECTDDRFLPGRYRGLDKEQVEERIAQLRRGL